MTPPQPGSHANSPLLSDPEDIPPLNVNTAPAELLKIAQQYEVEKNTAQAEVSRLNRKLADITDDSNSNNSAHTSKRQKTHHKPPPADLDEEEALTISRTHEHFVYQAGHKFFLLYAPWIRSGDNIFDTNIDEDYNAAK